MRLEHLRTTLEVLDVDYPPHLQDRTSQNWREWMACQLMLWALSMDRGAVIFLLQRTAWGVGWRPR